MDQEDYKRIDSAKASLQEELKYIPASRLSPYAPQVMTLVAKSQPIPSSRHFTFPHLTTLDFRAGAWPIFRIDR
jgi:hypothetical protein